MICDFRFSIWDGRHGTCVHYIRNPQSEIEWDFGFLTNKMNGITLNKRERLQSLEDRVDTAKPNPKSKIANPKSTDRGFTLIEMIIVLLLLAMLSGVAGSLFAVGLRVWDSGYIRTGIREDISYAMEKVIRDLKETANGSLSQYSSIAHTIQYDDLDGNTYVLYLYNADDGTLDSTYGESLYDLRKANISGGGWTEIIYDEFESSFGNWNDGGTDCIRYTSGTHAHQGNAAVDLQDNTSTSVVTTDTLSLSGYSEVEVDFWYKARSMESGEDFWLQISTNGGSSYTTVQTWARGTDFQNGTFYDESVTITGYSLTDQMRIRFRCDASGNGDDVYIDEIRVSAFADVTVENVVDTWQEL